MAKRNMKWLREKDENELEKLYMESNMTISRVIAQTKGELKNVELPKGWKNEYDNARKLRARILTLLNQRRFERAIWIKKQRSYGYGAHTE